MYLLQIAEILRGLSLSLDHASGMSYHSVAERAQALSLSSGLKRPTFSIVYILPKIFLFGLPQGRNEPMECIAPYKTTLILSICGVNYLTSHLFIHFQVQSSRRLLAASKFPPVCISISAIASWSKKGNSSTRISTLFRDLWGC